MKAKKMTGLKRRGITNGVERIKRRTFRTVDGYKRTQRIRKDDDRHTCIKALQVKEVLQ